MTSQRVASTAVAAILSMLALSATPPSIKGIPISIAISFHEDYSPTAVQEMEREVQSLLSDTNIHMSWIPRSAGAPVYFEGTIVIVDTIGTCKANNFDDLPRASALGWNDTTDGEFLPFVTLNCTRIAKFLKSEIPRRGEVPDKMFGRAAGRVLAHELFHFLTKSKHHANGSELFKAQVPPRILLDDGVRFTPDEVQRLLHCSKE